MTDCLYKFLLKSVIPISLYVNTAIHSGYHNPFNLFNNEFIITLIDDKIKKANDILLKQKSHFNTIIIQHIH